MGGSSYHPTIQSSYHSTILPSYHLQSPRAGGNWHKSRHNPRRRGGNMAGYGGIWRDMRIHTPGGIESHVLCSPPRPRRGGLKQNHPVRPPPGRAKVESSYHSTIQSSNHPIILPFYHWSGSTAPPPPGAGRGAHII